DSVEIPLAAPASEPERVRSAREPVVVNGSSNVRSKVSRDAPVPTPPFLGSRIVKDIPLQDVFRFLNERTLISTQWQFRKNNVPPREYERQMREVAYPALERLKQLCIAEEILRPAVVYGFFRCAASGNDLVIYEGDGLTERLRFRFPRQAKG